MFGLRDDSALFSKVDDEIVPIIPTMVSISSLQDPDVLSLFDVALDTDVTNPDVYTVRVLEHCARWFEATGVSIFLRRDGSDTFEYAASCGRSSKVPEGASFRLGEGLAGLAAKQGKARIVGDPTRDPSLAPRGVARRDEIGSSMIVPLTRSGGECIGVLNLARPADEPAFDEQNLAQVDTLGKLVTLAIGNARMYCQLNYKTSEARLLHTKLRNVIDSVDLGLIVVETDGTVSDANAVAIGLLGFRIEGGEKWRNVASRLLDPLAAACTEAVRKGIAGQRSNTHVIDSTGDKSYLVSCTPIPAGGTTLAIQDSTEYDRRERQIAKVERLAQIGQMTAAIAHEIRNPLTGIRSAASIVKTSPDMAGELGAIIENEVDKLNILCTDFLEFAKEIDLQRDSVDLAALVTRVCELVRSDADGAGVALRLDLQPCIRSIDARRIEQVVLNVVLNALQASGSGQTVGIFLQGSVLKVCDQGTGIPAEHRERVFTPFFTTKTQGTGLGLSTVKKILDAHGASYELKSGTNGTTFAIDFAGSVA